MIIGIKVPGLAMLITIICRLLNLLKVSIKDGQYPPIYDPQGQLYMERQWILKSRWWLPLSARFHRIVKDDPNHLHDHPWFCISIVMEGGYWEVMPAKPGDKGTLMNFASEPVKIVHRPAGSIVFRSRSSRHRLIKGFAPAKTIFIMGPKMQKWSFYVNSSEKIYWRDYLSDFTTKSSDDLDLGDRKSVV